MNEPKAPATGGRPADGNAKPAGGNAKPAGGTAKPAGSNAKPASGNARPAAGPAKAKPTAASATAPAAKKQPQTTGVLPKAPRVRGMPAARPAPDRPEPPRSVLLAVRAMYGGAVVTAIGLVITVIGIAVGGEAALRASHPHASAARLHATENFLITIAIVSGLVEIGLWLLMARANRGGLKWARIAATVLFALSTWQFVRQFFGAISPGNLVYTVMLWLVGLVAIYFLWQRESSTYFS